MLLCKRKEFCHFQSEYGTTVLVNTEVSIIRAIQILANMALYSMDAHSLFIFNKFTSTYNTFFKYYHYSI